MKWRRPCTLIPTVLCLSLVSGCATTVSAPPTEIPPNLTQECQKLRELPEKSTLLTEFYQADDEVIALYGECALRMKKLIEAVGKPTKGK